MRNHHHIKTKLHKYHPAKGKEWRVRKIGEAEEVKFGGLERIEATPGTRRDGGGEWDGGGEQDTKPIDRGGYRMHTRGHPYGSCSKTPGHAAESSGTLKDQTRDSQVETKRWTQSNSDQIKERGRRSSFMYKFIRVVTSSRASGPRWEAPIFPDGKWKHCLTMDEHWVRERMLSRVVSR